MPYYFLAGAFAAAGAAFAPAAGAFAPAAAAPAAGATPAAGAAASAAAAVTAVSSFTTVGVAMLAMVVSLRPVATGSTSAGSFMSSRWMVSPMVRPSTLT